MCLCLPVTLPATIMTSSVPTTVGGHMMYPSPHAVMYAPTSGLADGSLTVLNAFSQAPSTMQVSHSQVQEQGELGARLRKGGPLPPLHLHTYTNAPHTHSDTYTHTHKLGCPHIPTRTSMPTDCTHASAPTLVPLDTHTHTHTWTQLDTHPRALISETQPVICAFISTPPILEVPLEQAI